MVFSHVHIFDNDERKFLLGGRQPEPPYGVCLAPFDRRRLHRYLAGASSFNQLHGIAFNFQANANIFSVNGNYTSQDRCLILRLNATTIDNNGRFSTIPILTISTSMDRSHSPLHDHHSINLLIPLPMMLWTKICQSSPLKMRFNEQKQPHSPKFDPQH